MKLPAIQFYPADWRKDIGVQSLSFNDRGIWFEMLCVMHESEERGKLIQQGKPLSYASIARIIGCDLRVFKKALNNILNAGVASLEGEVIICRRMLRDDHLVKVRRECGKLGGNPNLKKEGSDLLNQKDNLSGKQKSTPSSSSSSSSSKKKDKKGGADAPANVPALYERCIEVYAVWFEKKFGTGAKIDGQQGKAMKQLISYFETQVKKKLGDAAKGVLSFEEIDNRVVSSLQFVFDRWDSLDAFLQAKTRLSDINSNIQNIIITIKKEHHGKGTGGQQQNGKDATIGRVNRQELADFITGGKSTNSDTPEDIGGQ